jgi:mannose-6-phosphate isomerase-like protein (cupin superfamily)
MEEITSRLKRNMQIVKEQLLLFSEEELCHKPAPEKWSRKEILGHLADSAINNLQRFTEIPASQGSYSVQPYPQDALVRQNRYQQIPTEEILLLWQSLNAQICRVISNMEGDTYKMLIQVGEEQKTLKWLVEDYLLHMEHHLGQIFTGKNMQDFQPLQYHIRKGEAATALRKAPTEFIRLLKYHDLEVEYYQPDKVDKQTPHDRDELYFIASGSGSFMLDGERYEVGAHDMLFVQAHKAHRFVDFTDDFATWVVFYGASTC